MTGRFFDGISSLPRTVKVEIRHHELCFEVVDNSGQTISLKWSAGSVKHEKHSAGSLRKIIHNSNELVFLELQDQDFRELDQWLEVNSVNDQKFALFLNRGLLVGILIFALSAIPLFYFIGIPILTDYAAERVPIELEQQMGKEMANRLLITYQEDEQRSAYADSLVACFRDSLSIPVKIHVVKSDELNAFALPGGHIFIYSEMLESCKTKEELIALLGHEIAHVQLRHTTRSMLRSMIGSILFSLVISDYGTIAGAATEQAAQLKDLSYSRELESEADNFSIELMRDNQLDANGIIRLFAVLEHEEKESDVSIPAFLSTHPLTKDRIDNAKEKIRENRIIAVQNEKMDHYFELLQ